MRIYRFLILFLPFTFLMKVEISIGQEKSKYMKKGMNYFKYEQYNQALINFEKEYQINPSIEVKFWIAHTYAELNMIKKAKPLFLEIVLSEYNGQEIAMSLTNLGNCYRYLKQFDSAYYYYDKAINESPEKAIYYFNKAQLLYSESKFEEAKIHFDKVIELDSNNWFYYQKRLEVCFALKDYNCALNDLIKMKKLNPDAKNEFNLAYCYSMLNRYHEADSIFLLIYDENDAIFLNNYGLNKHYLGKTKEAKKLIKISLDIDPKNSYAYRNLAMIEIDENNMTAACEYLNEAKNLEFEKNYGKEVNELLLKYCY